MPHGRKPERTAWSGKLPARPILQRCFRLCRLAAPPAVVAAFLLARALTAQTMDGRLRVSVRDASGRAVAAQVALTGRNPQFAASAQANEAGEATLRRIPPGIYRLRVSRPGFQDYSGRVEIRSAVPRTVEIALSIAPVRAEVTVEAPAPLLDALQPSQTMRAGSDFLERALGATLGRSTIDAVTTMPGWLLEANAVLHPRGSEYDTQYVIDGMPLYDNRSIAFAPAFENSEFAAVNVLTAGIPAEYGRRLGGVIALDTRRKGTRGNRSALDLQRSAYGTAIGAFSHQYAAESTVFSVGVQGGKTDRYLDPPALQNFTNKGSSSGLNASLSQDAAERGRVTFYLRSNRTGFLVPNDLEQQQAGQRQDRRAAETAGQVHYQHTFSARSLGSVRGMARDLTGRLWSNEFSTPAYVLQDRGFREGAVIADLTLESERHAFKLGGDVRVNDIRERFQLAEPDETSRFDIDFFDARRSVETSLFVQDHIRLGAFAANLGVRFDRYSLLVEDNAISPRVALSYYVPAAALQLRASYDRVFQPPPIENLLLSSAAPTLGLDAVEDALPVPASRANFFEIGLRKPLANVLRLDVSRYWRAFRNSIDDDVFLNTGLSFPITFASARIAGTEARLEMPRWRGWSSVVSYSNMTGHAVSPVTGGLFIEGGEADELRDAAVEFPISQDQRNTLAAQVRFEPHRRVWLMAGVRYGSGLPVELDDDDDDDDDDDEDAGGEEEGGEQPIPREILDKINFERGRVRPNLSLDFSVGFRVWERAERSFTLQFDLRNAADRLNVINFSGLFSGTALAPGRQAAVQMKLRF